MALTRAKEDNKMSTPPTPLDLVNNQPPAEDQQDQPPAEDQQDQPPAEDQQDQPPANDDMFPRAYVEQLRTENKDRREALEQATAAKDSLTAERDSLAGDLFRARVALDGRLADPSALQFSGAAEDLTPAAIEQAITSAIEANPRLSARAVSGDIGQGYRAGNSSVDLIGLMRGI